jgi:hypothetical protein
MMALEQSAQLSVQEALTLCAGTGLFSTNSTPEKSVLHKNLENHAIYAGLAVCSI